MLNFHSHHPSYSYLDSSFVVAAVAVDVVVVAVQVAFVVDWEALTSVVALGEDYCKGYQDMGPSYQEVQAVHYHTYHLALHRCWEEIADHLVHTFLDREEVQVDKVNHSVAVEVTANCFHYHLVHRAMGHQDQDLDQSCVVTYH